MHQNLHIFGGIPSRAERVDTFCYLHIFITKWIYDVKSKQTNKQTNRELASLGNKHRPRINHRIRVKQMPGYQAKFEINAEGNRR